jgi:hypothetical protein
MSALSFGNRWLVSTFHGIFLDFTNEPMITPQNSGLCQEKNIHIHPYPAVNNFVWTGVECRVNNRFYPALSS